MVPCRQPVSRNLSCGELDVVGAHDASTIILHGETKDLAQIMALCTSVLSLAKNDLIPGTEHRSDWTRLERQSCHVIGYHVQI